MKPLERKIWIVLSIALIGCIGLWFTTKHYQSKWTNVPPPPGKLSAAGAGLGDTIFAYRSYGILLQNMGDQGGRTTNLRDYNFENLGNWFTLLHSFDSKSNFIPYIASFYFGGVDDENHPQKLKPIVDYLEIAGNSTEGEKWRWLAQAAYIARFKMKDLDRALNIAQKLSTLDNPNLPMWARNMPANVLNAQGEKEAAYGLLLSILDSEGDKMQAAEINATKAYICEQILDTAEAKNNPLCQGDF
ncbi:hypothetical protein N9Z27_01725 [Alphaproteobacteria bacterium]|nr:hypothetical protein [Alphaproteobacteria bacterium]